MFDRLTIEGEEVTTTQPTLAEARAALFSIIATRVRKDRYAALLSRTRSSQARDLIQQVFDEVTLWQAASGKRARKLRDADAKSYHDALERLVGDLLRARAAKHATGRIFHALGRMTFGDVPVSYKVFRGVLDGLQGLSYLGVEPGTTRSGRTTFRGGRKRTRSASRQGQPDAGARRQLCGAGRAS